MKKITILSLIIVSTGLLAGCGEQVKEQVKEVEVQALCGTQDNNAYKKVEEPVREYLSQNTDVKNKEKQGYTLKEVCKSGGQALIFMDFEKGYTASMMKASITEDLDKIAGKVVIGLADETATNPTLHEIELPGYRFQGEGAVACHFHEFKGGKVTYTCYDASPEQGTQKTYSFDPQTGENKLIDEKIMEYQF